MLIGTGQLIKKRSLATILIALPGQKDSGFPFGSGFPLCGLAGA